MTKLVFCLMGPTASGKTDLAFELCQRYPFEVISVDSAMIYRDMTIGTAKPSSEELEKVPHHLIDQIDPIATYSAAQFCKDATGLCLDIISRGKLPLLVGGTMMYFNALQKGLSSLPEADEQTRQGINQEALNIGWPALHDKIKQIDPRAAARIHSNDTQRISRVLEVYYLTGKALSDHLEHHQTPQLFQFKNFILFPENRQWLHDRIAQRFEAMLAQGFIEEVDALLQKWPLTPEMPALRCVGYRQVYDYLQRHIDHRELKEKGIAATRQLAKRQLTWLRHWPEPLYFQPEDEDCRAKVMAKVQEILDNEGFYDLME